MTRINNHGKAKRNPSRICICCKDKVINKGCLYCKNCGEYIAKLRIKMAYYYLHYKKKKIV